MTSYTRSKMSRRVAIMAALSMSFSLAPAVVPTETGIFAPHSASAADITQSIQVTDFEIKAAKKFGGLVVAPILDPSGEEVTFNLTLPVGAKAGDAFEMYLATDDTDSKIPIAGLTESGGDRGILFGTDESGAMIRLTDPKGPAINSTTYGESPRKSYEGTGIYTVMQDVTENNKTVPMKLHFSKRFLKGVGKLGLFRDSSRKDPIVVDQQVIITTTAREMSGPNFSAENSTDLEKGIHVQSTSMSVDHSSASDENLARYYTARISERSDWRFYTERDDKLTCIRRMTLHHLSDTDDHGDLKFLQDLFIEENNIQVHCDNKNAWVYIPSAPKDQRVKVSFSAIKPYSDSKSKGTFYIREVAGPANTPIEDLKKKLGSEYEINLTPLHYPDVTPAIEKTKVQPTDATNRTLAYDKQKMFPGDVKKVPVKITEGSKFPDGSTFASTSNVPSGWVSINETTGEVTLSPKDAHKGKVHLMDFKVTYPDGSHQLIPLEVLVSSSPAPKDSDRYNPAYPKGTTVKQNGTATVPKPTGAPKGTTYGSADGAPSWATVNSDGTITVSPGYDIPPGKKTIPVTVTYPDKSTEVINAPVTVIEVGGADRYNPAYGDTVTVKQGTEGTVPAPKGAPEGSKFEKTPDTPDWITVNPDGSLTATPGTDVPPGVKTIPVKVTYPDGTSEIINAKVKVVDGLVSTDSGVTEVVPGAKDNPVTPGPGPKDNVKNYEGDPTNPDWAHVDPKTGDVSYDPDCNVKPGDHTVKVKVNYKNGSSSVITHKVKAKDPDMVECNQPTYEGIEVKQGFEGAVAPPKGTPEGSKFEEAPDTPDWVTVNPDGSLVVKPPRDAETKVWEIPVKVIYPDGSSSSEIIKAPVKVLPSTDAELNPPLGPDEGSSLKAGDTKKVPVDPNTDVNPAVDIEYSLGDGAPEWVTINPQTGELDLHPGCEVEPGEYKVPVVLTYPDGSTNTVERTVTVEKANMAECHATTYPDGNGVLPGNSIDIKPLNPVDGSTYDLEEGTPEWVKVDKDGVLKVTPGDDVAEGVYEVPVKITYPDGTSGTQIVKIAVGRVPDKDKYNLGDSHTVVHQGDKGVIPGPDAGSYPKGTKFGFKGDVPEWVKINPETGAIEYGVPCDAELGNQYLTVTATYPDGTVDEFVRVIEVVEGMNPACNSPAPAVPSVAKPLAKTGANVTLLGILAALMLAVGLGAFGYSRRKKS